MLGTAETPYACIVQHGNSTALASALEQIWRDGSAFSDNLNYAKGRLEAFSEKKQLTLLGDLLQKITAKQIKAALFSSSTIQGAGLQLIDYIES